MGTVFTQTDDANDMNVGQTRPGGFNPSDATHSGMRADDFSEKKTAKTESDKPVVGFLVSVSRTEKVEYWVIRQGQNYIGRAGDCQVLLKDKSVTDRHALLVVHRPAGEKMNVVLVDQGSSNGTYLNGEYTDVLKPHPCKDRDILKIGNYELLLMLFDVHALGLKKNDAFAEPASAAGAAGSHSDYSDRDHYTYGKETIVL